MADLGPSALVAAVGSSYRLESMLVARRLAAVAALLRHRMAAAQQADAERGYAAVDGFEQSTAEVAAAMNLSPMGPVIWCRMPKRLIRACPRWPRCWLRAERIGAQSD